MIKIFNLVLLTMQQPPKIFVATLKQDIFPFRLDTITSQSEVDLSDDTETEDILQYVPKQQQQA